MVCPPLAPASSSSRDTRSLCTCTMLSVIPSIPNQVSERLQGGCCHHKPSGCVSPSLTSGGRCGTALTGGRSGAGRIYLVWVKISAQYSFKLLGVLGLSLTQCWGWSECLPRSCRAGRALGCVQSLQLLSPKQCQPLPVLRACA